MAEQNDRQVRVLLANLAKDRMHVGHHGCPAILAGEVTVLIGVLAMAAVVVTVNDHATGCRGFGKALVATRVFAEAVHNLQGTRRLAVGAPDLQRNVVAIGRAQHDALMVSHGTASRAVKVRADIESVAT